MITIAADLHSHSGYAGGVGKISLEKIAAAMQMKGIDVFGTGDCLFPPRTAELQKQLTETSDGLYSFPGNSRFLLQTEIIISTRLIGYPRKIIAHHLLLFPDFTSIRKVQDLFRKWGMKNTIGRPFLTSENCVQLEDQLFELQDVHPLLEIIPAHIMTPEGIFGSRNNLTSLKEFYGGFIDRIRIIETGLSADPSMLQQIPDLEKLTFISNSDCHSSALNRIGREFSLIRCKHLDYPSIIEALRNNRIEMTIEFNPAEGRFFLTGHRADRQGHDQAVSFTDDYPQDLTCPICSRKMNLGVWQRCNSLKNPQITGCHRKFIHLIPLVEVIASSLGIKSVNSVSVIKIYNRIIAIFGTELALWQSDQIEEQLDKRIPQKTINQICAVQRGDFIFDPPGFDGYYGNLLIGAH